MKVVVTGGFGFIGSNLVRLLNTKGIVPYIIERNDQIYDKWRNMRGLLFHLVDNISSMVDETWRIVHLGADVDTTAPMTRELWANNVDYTFNLFKQSRPLNSWNTRFIYASSGAIYGNEEKDFSERINGMMPENAYAFTKWQLDSLFKEGPNIYGLRFFNVYGPGETHKGKMKSLVSRALDIKNGVFEIFKTGRSDIKDGDQARDFIHVEDLCEVIWYFITTEDTRGGLFNVGTGVATSFNEIADILNLEKKYIDMPDSVKNQYQYYTRADITKLRAHGYDKPFLSVREGIERMKTIK